ncbi:hypothetical protein J6590_108726 [Homalodisca vitripennis]|nr:hypothetical protein J6590_108335 [Homalodisca vitripennis]KAG8335942.1 hypothetical protein J6590_108726 [Homalodisca vitripennis]
MSSNLKWSDQVTVTCNRIFAGIHSLKRFALYLPFSVKVMLVKTLILPHFNYCDAVISDMTVELSDRLQRAQNYCIRFIFNLRRYEHVTPFFKQLSLLKLQQLRQLHILSTLHSVIKNKSPVYLSEHFKFISDISERPTRRGSTLLSIPVHRSNFFSKSFTVQACRLWNSLPDDIRIIEGRARFGAKVKDLLLAGLWG